MRLIICLLVALVVQVVSVHASDEIKSSSLEHAIQEGKKTFLHFCAVCHGKDGKGGDSSLYELKHPAPDLTILSNNHNGAFPWLDMFRVINSQESIGAHGSTEMPEWGSLFDLRNWGDEENDKFAEEIVYGRLFVLLVYLNSIQDIGASE